MKIYEIFESLQGEGMWLGMPSIFVRTAGCNLACTWCDSKLAHDQTKASEKSVAELVTELESKVTTHVVITGGEPTLFADEVAELCDQLHNSFKMITLETNATNFIDCSADLISMSPKLQGSQADKNLDCWNEGVIKQYMASGAMIQIKMVVANQAEAMDALIKVSALNIPKQQLFLMPQVTSRAEHLDNYVWLEEFCQKTGCRYGARLQTILWDNEAGK